MKVLVTGAAGYVGSHICVELLLSGHELLALDNFSTGTKDTLMRLSQITNQQFLIKECDIRSFGQLSNIIENFQPSAIIHCAGLKIASESIHQPIEYYDVNVVGTLQLVRAASRSSVNSILFSSTANVYGQPDYLPCDELHPTRPQTPYGSSKLMAERILNDWALSESSRRVVNLRYFNPIGAHSSGLIGERIDQNSTNIFPHILRVASGQDPVLRIFGHDYDTRDGTGERDYIHVVDLACGHLRALDLIQEFDRVQVLNLGTGKATTVLELVTAFEKATGVHVAHSFYPRRSGDISSSWADPSLAHKLIDFDCQLDLLDMCRSGWMWARSQLQ